MRPQDLAVVQETVVGVVAALRGDFDAEIKKLKAASDEWDKRTKLDAEQKRITKANDDLVKAQGDVEYSAKQHEQRLQQLQDALEKREAAVKEREAQVAKDLRQLSDGRDALAAREAAAKTNIGAMNAELQGKLEAAQQALDDLAGRESAISGREAKVKAALAQVGTLVQ